MKDTLRAIILAAGKGTRMNDPETPKCAHLFLNKPIINWIINACKGAGIEDIVVVVGYQTEKLIACLPSDVHYVTQETQDGTGHACKCAESFLRGKDGITIILPGDIPLITSEMLKGMIAKHISEQNKLTLMTSILDDPARYGRIFRENGNVKKIVEFKDCNEEQLKINEINVAIYAVQNDLLFDSIDKINNNNHAHEYYLTDIIEIIGNKYKVDSYVVPNDCHSIGLNDVPTLQRLEKEYLEELENLKTK